MYGKPPEIVGPVDTAVDEFMTYVYLPVVIPGHGGMRLPARVEPVRPIVEAACSAETERAGTLDGLHVYVTVKHGFATPDNPLNRPGWHCDGFGTDDINYVWWSRWGTRFALGDFGDVPDDHMTSLDVFERRVTSPDVTIRSYDDFQLLRLDPYVVHATPNIPAPGGMRTFVKVSLSPHRYNLRGNAHNHLFDYQWPMFDRDTLRNDPAGAQLDYVPDRTR